MQHVYRYQILNMQKTIIKIKGMHCASCSANITNALKKQNGIIQADVNFVTEKANVEYNEEKISLDQIKQVITNAGDYKIVDDSDDTLHDHNGDEKKQKIKTIAAIVLAVPLVLRMFWEWEIPGEIFNASATNWIQNIITFIIVFYLGKQFHVGAYKQLKKFKANMDTLISMGTLTAYFYSVYAMFTNQHLYFESAASITALILLGKYLELKTKGKASQAMKKLLELGVKKARVIDKNGNEQEIDIEEIKIDDIILVKPSEKIPLDGVVVDGHSDVNESMLTGESLPVAKDKDSKVFGATINQNGILKIKVTQIGENTVLAQIIKTVEEAQQFKAPIQKLADRISAIFVPIVIVIALLTFIGWYLTSGDFSLAIIYAVAVLVIACPCALGIATPVAVMVGTSQGAKNGILIKNGESFELAKNVDTIIFDKTGTLTKGEPRVQEVLINKDYNFPKDKVIKIGASLASLSEHPLSKAVVDYSKGENIKLANIKQFSEISGKGIAGVCTEHKTELLLGNRKIILENGGKKYGKENIKWVDKILEKYSKSGGTIIFVSHGAQTVGGFLIADEIKEDAKATIEKIRKMGMKSIMLTGDNKDTAKVVSDKIGIDEFLAEVMPAQKSQEVKILQELGKKVVFVGDGINDAPSLVQADLGIAMGTGTDIAREAGNIILMQSDPMKVVEAIKLSQKTFRIIKQNLFWAFFYNVLAIPLAIAGLINPMIAAIAMSSSSITVIGNSLRIKKK